jgi:hypothetical protein
MRVFGSDEARRLAWLLGAAIVLAALCLNARVTGFGFLYLRDDDVIVTLNPHMGAVTAERLRWMFTDWSYARRYIPLGWLGFSATYGAAGLDPLLYHLVGLVLYLLNCTLVFVLSLHAVRLARIAASSAGLGPWEVGAAALAAGWWAFNPLRVETTAWVSGNLYGQATALLLVSGCSYLRSWMTEGLHRALWIALSAATYAASLLSYPIGLGIAFVLLGVDLLLFRVLPSHTLRRLVLEKAAFFVPLAAVLSLPLVARVQGVAVYGAVPDLHEITLGQRIAQAAYITAYYVWKPWFPVHLSPLYDTLASIDIGRPLFLASLAGVAAVSALAIGFARRRPWIAVAWFGYLAVVIPFLGLTERVAMASDRYACVPTVLMACLIASGTSWIGARGARIAAASTLALFAFAFGCLTSGQLEPWRNDRDLHLYVLGLLGDTPLRDDFLGRKVILDFMRGDEEMAAREAAAFHAAHPGSGAFAKADAIMADKRRVAPYYGSVCLLAILQDQMGLSFARSHRPDEADEHFRSAIEMDGRFYQAAFDRALVLLDLGRGRDALASYLRAARWAPGPLPVVQRRAFLSRLRTLADSSGDGALASAAGAALAH